MWDKLKIHLFVIIQRKVLLMVYSTEWKHENVKKLYIIQSHDQQSNDLTKTVLVWPWLWKILLL